MSRQHHIALYGNPDPAPTAEVAPCIRGMVALPPPVWDLANPHLTPTAMRLHRLSFHLICRLDPHAALYLKTLLDCSTA